MEIEYIPVFVSKAPEWIPNNRELGDIIEIKEGEFFVRIFKYFVYYSRRSGLPVKLKIIK